MKYVIAYDLGTGGIKTSVFDSEGISRGYSFLPYPSYFPRANFREQKPEDWWLAVVKTTREVLAKTAVSPSDIVALAVSGHSLGVVPIGKSGELLAESTPLWNDSRSTDIAKEFWNKTSEKEWYLSTGNGFPPELYSVFKILWYKRNMPELYSQCDKFIGTKDYINYKMTGVLATDHSYASGSGVYSLKNSCYDDKYIKIFGIDKEKLPEIKISTDSLGKIKSDVAAELGLSPETLVLAGGVDNACMALGAGCIGGGDVYTSLGTSAWIAVSDCKPVLDFEKRPYVFAHCVPGQYVSATAIFSAGNSLSWARDNLFSDASFAEIDALAEKSPTGARGLLFLPTLAGGSSLDKSPRARGGFVGLDLMHKPSDIARSVLEGIAINLRVALDVLKKHTAPKSEMLVVGGGAKSSFWRKIFADAYAMDVFTSKVAQDAGSFGAAAVAAVGAGLWKDFSKVQEICKKENVTSPTKENTFFYESILPIYRKILDAYSDFGDEMLKIYAANE